MRAKYEFDETADKVILTVETYSPTKWLLVDRETGQVFQGNPGGYWDRLDPVVRGKSNGAS